jgi:hypothetical protein
VDGHLYIGAPVFGNLEEGLSIRDSESRKSSGEGISSYTGSGWGTWWRACLPGFLRVRRRGFVSMTPCVGHVVQRRKPQSTFCVSVRL